MYPTVVIVLVETQRSMVDVWKIIPSNTSELTGLAAPEAHSTTLGHISFAPGPLGNEAESQRSRTLKSHGGGEHGLEEVILDVNLAPSAD